MPHRRRSSMMAGMAGGRASRRNSHRSKRRRSNRGSTPSVDADPKTAHPTTMLPPPRRPTTTTTTTTTTTMRSHGCHSCRVRRICVPIGIWPIRPRRCSPGNAETGVDGPPYARRETIQVRRVEGEVMRMRGGDEAEGQSSQGCVFDPPDGGGGGGGTTGWRCRSRPSASRRHHYGARDRRR